MSWRSPLVTLHLFAFICVIKITIIKMVEKRDSHHAHHESFTENELIFSFI